MTYDELSLAFCHRHYEWIVMHIVPQQKRPIWFICVTIASMCMACYEDAILSSTQGKIVVGVIIGHDLVAKLCSQTTGQQKARTETAELELAGDPIPI